MKCPKCNKPLKKNTDGNKKYCQGHGILDDDNDNTDTETLCQKLVKITNCRVQHDGWPCNTCFHCLGSHLPLKRKLKKDIHEYWLAVLALRGDYPELPKRPDLIKELSKALS